MRMNWFRVYNEARNDAKLRTLSDGQFRVWFNLLCLSSEQSDRGIIDDYELDLLSIEVAGGDDELLTTTLNILCRLRIIRMSRPESVTGVTGVTVEFIHFDDRQYDKPSDLPEATAERKRKQREREKQAQESDIVSNKEGVTPRHALSHPEKRREEEIRRDKNREEEIDSATANAVGNKLPETSETFWPQLWQMVERDLGYKPTWNYGAETKAIKRLLVAYPQAPPSDFAAFLRYKHTCFGIDPAGQVSFVKYGHDFAAWVNAGKPTKQEKNNGKPQYRTSAEKNADNLRTIVGRWQTGDIGTDHPTGANDQLAAGDRR